MDNIGHWVCLTKFTPSYGFIYRIKNLTTGRMYIGKKQMVRSVCKPPLKGRKNHRRSVKESDWKTYTGSCRELNEDIKKYGKDNFGFFIEQFCQSKWELSYYETKMQFNENVLESDKYYNGIINCRLGKKPKNLN